MPELLTLRSLFTEATAFSKAESLHSEPTLYGVTDGKKVGTYLEQKFTTLLCRSYTFDEGNSAKGIDFPGLGVDIKVTSIRQPQSSCPYKSARQKIYGLGYSLLVFVYDKQDDPVSATARLSILHTVFVDKDYTADYQTTSGLRKLLENDANKDDILGFLQERLLPVDDIEAGNLADEIMSNPPRIGYLTISNALQWRLQYSRVIEKAGMVEGVHRLT